MFVLKKNNNNDKYSFFSYSKMLSMYFEKLINRYLLTAWLRQRK